MAEQLDFFAAAPALPAGLRFEPELIAPDAERGLLEAVRALPFEDFSFHGYVGKRRTVSFGAAYDFTREALGPASALPDFLIALRETAAAFAGIAAGALRQVLVTEYGAGAGIGWHRDKPVFGEIVGISLLSSCRFRLRRRHRGAWERVTLEAGPRSAYLLSGVARTEWEHSIPPVEMPRYSITYRTFR